MLDPTSFSSGAEESRVSPFTTHKVMLVDLHGQKSHEKVGIIWRGTSSV